MKEKIDMLVFELYGIDEKEIKQIRSRLNM
jgi:spore coat polysaccharide biosynthesis predicted glycosyltransferase SpsG